MIILFIKFIKCNQSKSLNLSEASLMSSWNIAKKATSLFLLLIHGLIQTHLGTFLCCYLSWTRGIAKILLSCAFFMIKQVESQFNLLFIKLREILSGLCFYFLMELSVSFNGMVSLQNKSHSKQTNSILLQRKCF